MYNRSTEGKATGSQLCLIAPLRRAASRPATNIERKSMLAARQCRRRGNATYCEPSLRVREWKKKGGRIVNERGRRGKRWREKEGGEGEGKRRERGNERVPENESSATPMKGGTNGGGGGGEADSTAACPLHQLSR